jgi:C-terminal processing protease CtpA/Prc
VIVLAIWAALPYAAGTTPDIRVDNNSSKGIIVVEVTEGSAAERAGVLPGDVIKCTQTTRLWQSVGSLVCGVQKFRMQHGE